MLFQPKQSQCDLASHSHGSFLGLGRVCLYKLNHLYWIYTVAEYFLQDGQIVPVHGGNFSLFKLGGEPA